MNTENCNIGMICKDIIQFLISIDDEANYADIYQNVNRSLQGYYKTLITLDNLFETNKMQFVFESIDTSFFEIQFWLFLDR